MEYLRYAQFLPADYRREPLIEPTSTWWQWRGHRVHVARAVRPDAAVRVLLIHGAGGHAGLLWPFAALAANEGVEAMAIDLPLYGDTVEPDPNSVRYAHWVQLLSEFVGAERESDDRPLILFGASMGGMLAYEAAARTRAVAHVVATCLLDPADPAARRAAARWSFTGDFAPVLLRSLTPLAGLRVPIRWLVDMRNMSLDPALSDLCGRDPKGGGVHVPLGFLADFLNFRHTPPEEFTAAPVTLVHPGADRWTPPSLSLRFLARIPGRTRAVLLDGCGHFPIEEPGLSQLATTLRAVLAETSALTPPDRR
ncbi:alpha/beta hydrolase [Nocardia amikacinitolerans]|uniref:alpha/beta hydrolase n=1 Tax=Nocardia amikacinitolerans TaxID=756689 RepID=UPI0020A57A58|nr:alpha/beta hydrolase [Nocardia amikacinitolerans]MCP2290757.1 Lysophospholipase, alpha-beta hydrolase superfamily [Nocardia amikacinitolerans]